ncbi:MAG: sugar phosphate nucleotidyltransferase [Gaiellaceae bacterium]
MRDAIVLAAGEGTRLRPLTERWTKPVLPIDGRPVIATLLHELAAGGVERVWLVTGHLAEQVESLAGDGSVFGLDLRFARQPRPNGSADAVRCALEAGAPPEVLLSAADTLYTAGDAGRFARAVAARPNAAGAIAFRAEADRRHHTRIHVEAGRVLGVPDPAGAVTAAPLMALREPVAVRMIEACRPPFRPPFEVAVAFQAAIDAGEEVVAVEIGCTRDLTHPVDLVEENFPYLRGL